MVFNLTRSILFFAFLILLTAFIPSWRWFRSNGQSIDTLNRSSFVFERQLSDSSIVNDTISFPSSFSSVAGVTTFRGGPRRDRPSYGIIDSIPKSLNIKWSFSTGLDAKWGGGAGWTGQPVIIRWADSIRFKMNIATEFKKDSLFTEVILGSLDGKIYFLDLNTGKPTRDPINIKNPIKGSVSVDPRGLPILYAGQGISNTSEFGVRIFSLIDQSRLYFLNGRDPFAYRAWSAFDSSPLVFPEGDLMFVGGENGVVYRLDLHSTFTSSEISIQPLVSRARYLANKFQYQGIENSLVGYNDKLYLSDNHGFIQCLRANDLSQVWVTRNHDDTDASLVLEEENGNPFLYTGNEVDLQGEKGSVHLKKIDGLTGSTIWERLYPCLTIRGEHPVNGGMLSTPIIGKNNSDSLMVFCLSRYGGINKGLLTALRKDTGEKVWEFAMDNYAWSSPLDIYDTKGNMYVFTADSKGNIFLINGSDGKLIYKEKIAELFEASPASIDNKIIIASRPRKIFCLEVK